MNERELLRFYLARGGPESQRWNLSPENLSAELCCRRLLRGWMGGSGRLRVCNVGIGAGEWDDFLGYWLEGRGRVVSIDRDRRVCELLRYRQARERHPNPARVICGDVKSVLPGNRFDLVSMVGSTAKEARDYSATLSACLRMLKAGGRLFYMDFNRLQRPRAFIAAMKAGNAIIRRRFQSARGAYSHFAFLARKARRGD